MKVIANAELAEAIAELRRVRDQIAKLEEQKEELSDFIRQSVKEGNSAVDEFGVKLVTVKPGTRVFNEDVARENLPPNLLAAVTVTEERINKDLCQELLSKAAYEQCCRVYRPSVVIA